MKAYSVQKVQTLVQGLDAAVEAGDWGHVRTISLKILAICEERTALEISEKCLEQEKRSENKPDLNRSPSLAADRTVLANLDLNEEHKGDGVAAAPCLEKPRDSLPAPPRPVSKGQAGSAQRKCGPYELERNKRRANQQKTLSHYFEDDRPSTVAQACTPTAVYLRCPEERLLPVYEQVEHKGTSKKPRRGEGAEVDGYKFKRLKVQHQEPAPSIPYPEPPEPGPFITAKQKLVVDASKKGGLAQEVLQSTLSAGYGSNAKSLGVRRGARGGFVPPVRAMLDAAGGARNSDDVNDAALKQLLCDLAGPDGELPERIRNIEPRLLELINNEIIDKDPNVRWEDIAGLDHAKKTVNEVIVWPLLRPDIFKGCRSPGKGLLLFGPPGTGKTMIGKAIAGEAKATFFSISASSLTSKWIGEGEKMVRALFGVASCKQPAVIFIDEIDSLLSQRKSEGEHESSRRIKTQFLIEMEGCGGQDDRILLVGATNRPQELDEAARRRLSKRLYIPLPSREARAWIIKRLLKKDGLYALEESEVEAISSKTEGYSGSDMTNLVKEASMGPLREAMKASMDISSIATDTIRAIGPQDFVDALDHVRPSVSPGELGAYEDWNRQFGSFSL